VSISGVGSPEAVSDRLVAAVDDHRSATGGFGVPLRAIGDLAADPDAWEDELLEQDAADLDEGEASADGQRS
jgi:hypothetical protein